MSYRCLKAEIPTTLPDCRDAATIAEDHQRATQYAKPGSVQHFLLRQGFMPDNEQVAEAILTRLIREREWLENYIEMHYCREHQLPEFAPDDLPGPDN